MSALATPPEPTGHNGGSPEGPTLTVRRLSSPGWPKGWCLSWGVRCAACAVLVTAAGCGGGRAESHPAAARAPAPMYVHCGGGKRLDAGRLVGLTLARARGLVRCN